MTQTEQTSDPGAGNKARVGAIVAGLIGLSVATAVVGYFNFGAVLAAIRPIGVSGFLIVIAAQVALFVSARPGLADKSHRGRPTGGSPSLVFMWGRLMREAASDVLPFSQLGGLGHLPGAWRCWAECRRPADLASSVIDITVEIAAQLIYTLVGIALLARRLGEGPSKRPSGDVVA